MANNVQFREGNSLTLPVPAGTVAGSPVIIGTRLPGVAMTSRDSAGNATVRLSGVFRLSVTFTANRAIGDTVFILQGSNSLSDATGASKYPFGVLLEAWNGGAGTGTVQVRVGAGAAS